MLARTWTVLIAHAEDEEDRAEELAIPLEEAGYRVAHRGTVLVGESPYEEASKLLVQGGPVVLCGTVKALGTGWAHRLVQAARPYDQIRVFAVRMEEKAYLEQITPDAVIAEYWRDPALAIQELIAALKKYFPLGAVTEPPLVDYLSSHVERYRRQTWTQHAIDLNATTSSGSCVNARQFLSAWAYGSGSPRVVFLTGDVGSGKTALVQWLAADLASDRAAPVPIVIPLRPELPFRPMQDLQMLADPPVPVELLSRPGSPIQFIFLLDGLDETIDPFSDSRALYRKILVDVLRLVPPQSRVLISCRLMTYTPIKQELATIVERYMNTAEFTRADLAIDIAIGGDLFNPEILTLRDVEQEKADQYLVHSDVAEIWKRVRKEDVHAQFTRLPLTIRFLEKALPRLINQTGMLDLDILHNAVVKSLLLQEQRLDKKQLSNFMEDLKELANPLSRKEVKADSLVVLVSAGLLRPLIGDASRPRGRSRRTGLTFSHQSFREYCFSMSIRCEMEKYDAGLLSKVDLIRSYNINRFLVPMLLKMIPGMDQERNERDGAENSRADTKMLKPVTCSEFAQFVGATGWRRDTGYGVHPDQIIAGAMPHLSTSGMFELEQPTSPLAGRLDEPINNLSWYDAFQYCRWARTRPPTSGEFKSAGAGEPGAPYAWSWEWYDEPRGYVRVFSFAAGFGAMNTAEHSSVGVNPDYRSNLIGLRVVTTET